MDRDIAERILEQVAQLRQDGEETRKDLAQLRRDGEETRKDLAQLRQHGEETRKDLAQLRQDGEETRKDLAQLRRDGEETRKDVARIHQDGEETRRHFDVVAEGLRGDIRQLADGLARVDERLEAFRAETKEEFIEVRAMIKLSYSELDRRLSTLETSVVSLESRVGRLESVG